MPQLLRQLFAIRFVRYFLASLCALALDMAVFFALIALGTWPAIAGATGYLSGIIAHWLLSSRAVFTGLLAPPGRPRTGQKMLFLLSALIGLGLTTSIVWSGTAAGFAPGPVKMAAILISFPSVWLMRSRIVFAR